MNQVIDNQVSITERELIEDIRWAMTALPGKEETREFLKFIQVYDNKVVASDGHRIHKLETTWIPEGNYTVTKNTKTKMILVRPIGTHRGILPSSIEKILNTFLEDCSGRKIVLYPLSSPKDEKYVWTELTDALMFRKVFRKLHKAYNYQYLAAALPVILSTTTQIWENDKAVRIQGERREAVIMSIRV